MFKGQLPVKPLLLSDNNEDTNRPFQSKIDEACDR
jgi:hypothetical protein